MTDDRRTTAVALPGDPAGWRATLRDLLRHLRAASPDREAAVEWLREEAGATDRDAADAQLSFLAAAGLVAVDDDGGVRPGPNGREFLDTHDEGVLYEALVGAVGGFGTLLESLAVRPLTDVEFRDLLERVFDTDIESTARVRPHRQWLEALGYVEHEDGVNDLTRAGRRRVETDDDLTPPRASRPGGRTGGPADVGTGSGGGASSDGDTVGDTAATGAEDAPAGTVPGGADRGAGGGNQERAPTPGANADESFASLKRRYDHTCMVCGDRRQRAPDEGHALVHHPMPTGDPHGGPAEAANAVVVCPNHRADFRRGLLRVDPRTHEITHAYEEAVSGRRLETADGHDLGAQYLAYHNEVVADF